MSTLNPAQMPCSPSLSNGFKEIAHAAGAWGGRLVSCLSSGAKSAGSSLSTAASKIWHVVKGILPALGRLLVAAKDLAVAGICRFGVFVQNHPGELRGLVIGVGLAGLAALFYTYMNRTEAQPEPSLPRPDATLQEDVKL